MKKLRSLFLCSILFFAIQIQAQTPTVKWGQLLNNTAMYATLYNGAIYTKELLRNKGTFMEKIDTSSMMVILHKDYNAEKVKNMWVYDSGPVLLAGGLFMEREVHDHKANVTDFYLLPVDTATLTLGEKRFVTKHTDVSHVSYAKGSPNDSLLLFYSEAYYGNNAIHVYPKKLKALNVTVFDVANNKVLWKKVVPLGGINGDCTGYEVTLTNSGSIIGYASFNDGSNTNYRLLHITDKGVNMDKKILEGGKFANEPLFCQDKTGECYLVGTYSLDGVGIWSNGWYWLKVKSATGEVLQSNTYSFSEKAFLQDKSTKDRKIANLKPYRITQLSNGNVVALFQKTFYSSQTSPGPQFYDSERDYVPENFGRSTTTPTYTTPGFKLLASVNNAGERVYETVIPCEGYTQQNGIVMYENKANSLALFYRSYVKTGKEKPVRFTCTTVDESGNYSINSLVDEFTADVYPNSTTKFKENQFLIYHIPLSGLTVGYGILNLK